MHIVLLRNDRLLAEVMPQAGGGLARLDTLAGGARRQVLRGLSRPAGSPPPTTGQLACFPLVPWSNRISPGGFAFEGRAVALASNRAGEPCPIHGDGWQHAWAVASQSDTSVLLELDRRDGNPFAYRARLRYTLLGDALEVMLDVCNEGSATLPYGLGLHPWLPRSEGVTLRAHAGACWGRGGDGLPLGQIAFPDDWNFSDPRRLPTRAIDNVFSGWDGQADIAWPDTGISLRISADMGYYIVYTRPGADFFCFEPVDHMINAHNLPGGPVRHGLTVLAPGQALARSVSFQVATAR